MFSRIRYAAHVLSSPRVNPYEHADLVFEEEKPVEVTRVARAIGVILEIIVISSVIGVFAAPLITRVWPFHTTANVNETTAIIAAILGMLAMYCFERVKSEIRKHLQISEKIAPYFGHKIVETYKTLLG